MQLFVIHNGHGRLWCNVEAGFIEISVGKNVPQTFESVVDANKVLKALKALDALDPLAAEADNYFTVEQAWLNEKGDVVDIAWTTSLDDFDF